MLKRFGSIPGSISSAIIFLCALKTSAFAYTLYVSPTGNDSNSGTSATAPLATLQRANDLLEAAALTDPLVS